MHSILRSLIRRFTSNKITFIITDIYACIYKKHKPLVLFQSSHCDQSVTWVSVILEASLLSILLKKLVLEHLDSWVVHLYKIEIHFSFQKSGNTENKEITEEA